LKHVATFVKPGISTLELDVIAEDFIRKRGGVPAFKGYNGFPCTLCTSVNDQVVHGIPSKKQILKTA
jgi:methionyl aminopeptidase